MDLPEYDWYYDAGEEAIVATITTIVHTYFFLGCMHGVEELDLPLVPAVILEAPPTLPLAP